MYKNETWKVKDLKGNDYKLEITKYIFDGCVDGGHFTITNNKGFNYYDEWSNGDLSTFENVKWNLWMWNFRDGEGTYEDMVKLFIDENASYEKYKDITIR